MECLGLAVDNTKKKHRFGWFCGTTCLLISSSFLQIGGSVEGEDWPLKGKMKTQFRSAFILVHVNLLGFYFHYHRHVRPEVSLSEHKYTLTRATTNSIFQRRPQPLHYFCEGHNHRKISTRAATNAIFQRGPQPTQCFHEGIQPMQYFNEDHYHRTISTRATTNAIFPRGPLPRQYFHEVHYQCSISTWPTTNAIFPRGPLLSMADPLLMQDLNTLSRNSLNNTTSNTRHRQTPDLALDYILPPSIGIGKRCLECGPHSILALTYNTRRKWKLNHNTTTKQTKQQQQKELWLKAPVTWLGSWWKERRRKTPGWSRVVPSLYTAIAAAPKRGWPQICRVQWQPFRQACSCGRLTKDPCSRHDQTAHEMQTRKEGIL